MYFLSNPEQYEKFHVGIVVQRTVETVWFWTMKEDYTHLFHIAV